MIVNKSWDYEKNIKQGPETYAIMAIIGTAASVKEQRKQASLQRKAQKGQQRIAEFKAAREKRKQIRQQRVLAAEIQQQAVASGTQATSGVAGGIANVQSQTAANVADIQRQESLGASVSRNLQKAADARSRSATFGAIAQVGSQFAGTKGFEELGSSIFGN